MARRSKALGAVRDSIAIGGISMVGAGVLSRVENQNPGTGGVARSGRQAMAFGSAVTPGLVGLGVVGEINDRLTDTLKKKRR